MILFLYLSNILINFKFNQVAMFYALCYYPETTTGAHVHCPPEMRALICASSASNSSMLLTLKMLLGLKLVDRRSLTPLDPMLPIPIASIGLNSGIASFQRSYCICCLGAAVCSTIGEEHQLSG